MECLAFIVIFWVGIPRVSSQGNFHSLLSLGDFLIWKIRFTPTENPGDMQVPKSLVKVVKHPRHDIQLYIYWFNINSGNFRINAIKRTAQLYTPGILITEHGVNMCFANLELNLPLMLWVMHVMIADSQNKLGLLVVCKVLIFFFFFK